MMDQIKEFIERMKIAILDWIADMKILFEETVVKAKSKFGRKPSGYSQTSDYPPSGNFSEPRQPERVEPSPVSAETIPAPPPATTSAQPGKPKIPNFFTKLEDSVGKKFWHKVPGRLGFEMDRFFEIFAANRHKIIIGTAVFMLISSAYMFANLAFVYSQQRSVLAEQETSISDGESLLKKLKEFDVSTLTPADVELNPDLDTFMYNQNEHLGSINQARGETVRFGTVKWDEKNDSFSEMNFVDVSKYATIDDVLMTLSFWKTWFRADSLEIENAYNKERWVPYIKLKFAGKLMK